MEPRLNSPFHEQPTKQSLPVLHKSGLAESSKKAVLGSTENTLGRSGTDAGKGKGKGKSRDKRGQSRVTGQPTSSSTSQAGMRLHQPRPVPARCTSRDHESDECPKNQELRKLHGASLELNRLVHGFRCDVQHNSRDFRLREPGPWWCVLVGPWSNKQCWKRVSVRSDS